MPRQLSSVRYEGKATTGIIQPSGWTALLSPVSSIASLFGALFGGTKTVTRYREQVRAPFHQAEAISPETHAASMPINESASGLFLVNSTVATNSTSGTSLGQALMQNRQAVTTVLRRTLNESRGFADVLNEFQDGL